MTLPELLRTRRVLVLTGAGCSTDSGIPDYRGPGSAPRTPVQYRAFVGDPEARRRYWARSLAGWPMMATARPNAAHRALAELQRAGRITSIITQNVDGLHQAAGAEDVLELHGALADVVCLACGAVEPRQALQRRLTILNPRFEAHAEIAPDGDAELQGAEGFRIPDCLACGGMLKPRVVFFGENVPVPVVEEAWRRFEAADALLVLGSSLTVWSGYRFARKAAETGRPLWIVNRGPTRADPLATAKIDAGVAEVLGALVGGV